MQSFQQNRHIIFAHACQGLNIIICFYDILLYMYMYIINANTNMCVSAGKVLSFGASQPPQVDDLSQMQHSIVTTLDVWCGKCMCHRVHSPYS